MARNRKKRNVNGFIFPVPFAGAVVMASGLALGYVWLGCQCEQLGREIKTLEAEHGDLQKRYMNSEYRWARIKSLRSLEIALQKHNLCMDWPRRDQVVRLPDRPLTDDRDQSLIQGGTRLAKLKRIVMHD